jgi:hypothetical protein
MPEQIEKIWSRSTINGSMRMWGTLHVSRPGGNLVGWIVDTWTEAGEPPRLQPRMHWVPRDGKFHHMHMNIDHRSSILMGEEDTDIEPTRAAFIKATLGLWEQEWMEEGAKKEV